MKFCFYNHLRFFTECTFICRDNVNTDIFGANLYNQYLERSRAVARKRSAAMGARNIYHLLGNDPDDSIQEAEQCYSVLVEVKQTISRDKLDKPGHKPDLCILFNRLEYSLTTVKNAC